jgi:epoxyqueuosine reductase QueG
MRTEDLRRIVEAFVSSYPNKARVRNWWRKPHLATAETDDRFEILPKIASDEHLLPWDLLPSANTLIVFFLPFVKALIDENSPGQFPCRNWGVAYEETNALIGLVAEELRAHLAEHGYKSALTPATHNFDQVRLVSRWSHKHLAHLSGLGRFGVNAQLITPSGCAGRLGSLVTEAKLGNNPLVKTEELCLHKAGEECLKCLGRCPVRAVKAEGIDRRRCWTRLRENLNQTEELAGLKETTHVCGKCVVDLPCSYFNG